MARIWLLLFPLLLGFLSLVKGLTCSSGLALSGYPYCADGCFSICDKYCTTSDIEQDIYCPCRKPDYLSEMARCLHNACSPADFSTIVLASATNCLAAGIDITDQFVVTTNTSSSSSTAGPTTTSSSTNSPSETANKDEKKGSVPIGPIVGGVVGGLAVVVITIIAIVWVLRKRKANRPKPLQAEVQAHPMVAKPLLGESETKPHPDQQPPEYQGTYLQPPAYQAAELDPQAFAQPTALEVEGREIPRPVYEMQGQARR